MFTTIKQLVALFLAMKLKRKFFLISILLVTIIFFIALIFFPLGRNCCQPLFSERTLSSYDIGQMKGYLKKNGVSYRHKGDQLFVSNKEVDALQREMREKKVLSEERQAGFELFDTNTWIKGEKELQMLEVRALKGELEKDIAGFDNIKQASVILDLAPQKLFGSAKYQTKASVILTLEEHAELSTSQLRAITYHLSGAVRGLEPNMIAISDTTGTLYKAIHLDGEDELLRNPTMSQEESVMEKITKLMNRLVGRGNFHLTLNLIEDKKAIVVALMIQNSALNLMNQESIEHQLRALLMGFEKEPVIAIDFVTFDTMGVKEPVASSWFYTMWPYLIGALLFIATMLFFLMQQRTKERGIDMHKLADQLKEQEPKTIALLFSYLDPERAGELLAALPYQVQKSVALHLTKIESEERC